MDCRNFRHRVMGKSSPRLVRNATHVHLHKSRMCMQGMPPSHRHLARAPPDRQQASGSKTSVTSSEPCDVLQPRSQPRACAPISNGSSQRPSLFKISLPKLYSVAQNPTSRHLCTQRVSSPPATAPWYSHVSCDKKYSRCNTAWGSQEPR